MTTPLTPAEVEAVRERLLKRAITWNEPESVTLYASAIRVIDHL